MHTKDREAMKSKLRLVWSIKPGEKKSILGVDGPVEVKSIGECWYQVEGQSNDGMNANAVALLLSGAWKSLKDGTRC